MRKEYKLYLFKDRKDYKKILSNDNIINVIGTKGSGKTTLSKKYIYNEDWIVINCDSLFDLPGGCEETDKELVIIKDMLKEKYGSISNEGQKFLNYYNDIISYANLKEKKVLIEGNAVQTIEPITLLKGTIIIKRTGIIKCFIRTIKRDYPNEYFMKLEIEKHGKLGKFYRLFNIVKRRKKIFYEYKDLESKIQDLEKLI